MLDIIRGKSQSFITKVIFGLIILAFIFLGVGNFSGSSQHVVATVNGHNIPQQDFAQALQNLYEQERAKNPSREVSEQLFEQMKMQVLSSMVQEELMLQEAERLELFVSPHELLAEVAKVGLFQDAKGRFDKNRYTDFLKQSKQTPAQFESRYMRKMLLEKLAQAVVSSVGVTQEEAKNFFNFMAEQRTAEYVLFAAKEYTDKVTLEDSELSAYYETHKAAFVKPADMDIEYITITPKTLAAGFTASDDEIQTYYNEHREQFTDPAQYKVSHIFLIAPPDGEQDAESAKERDRAKATLEDIQKQLKDGASFAELAKKYSEDKGSAEKGGELEWIAQGSIPEFEVALGMKPGDVSGIVRTPAGFHLLQLKDIKSAHIKPIADVKKMIKDEVAQQKAQDAEKGIRDYVNEELGKGTDFAAIGKHLSLPVQKTGVVEKSRLNSMLALHSDAMAAIENIPVGETSPAPVDIVDGVALIKVVASDAERQLTLDEVKERITDVLKKDKAALLARKAASEALASFTGSGIPEAYNSKVKSSQPFTRLIPFVPPLANSNLLAEHLSMAAQGEWLPQTYDTAEGTVIARVKEVIPASEKDWEMQGPMLTNALWQSKQQDVIQAFLNNLRETGSVTMNPEALEAMRINR